MVGHGQVPASWEVSRALLFAWGNREELEAQEAREVAWIARKVLAVQGAREARVAQEWASWR